MTLNRTYHADNTMPKGRDTVFVFGSNLAGRHGKGAAKAAHVNFSARYGVGKGRTGMAYAIPTKDGRLKTLALEQISQHVSDFLAYARAHPQIKFFVTRIGCGLAGHEDQDIAPMFLSAPANCSLPLPWKSILEA